MTDETGENHGGQHVADDSGNDQCCGRENGHQPEAKAEYVVGDGETDGHPEGHPANDVSPEGVQHDADAQQTTANRRRRSDAWRQTDAEGKAQTQKRVYRDTNRVILHDSSFRSTRD